MPGKSHIPEGNGGAGGALAAGSLGLPDLAIAEFPGVPMTYSAEELQQQVEEVLLPRIIDSGYDLRLHIEIKANMRRSQLRTLAEAGMIYVQPGIESLNSRVLGLMDKGVSGCQNVRMLRDGAETARCTGR